MPLKWTFDPAQRLTTIVAQGNIAREEIVALLNATEAAGALSYRRIFDGTKADTDMGSQNVFDLGVLMRSYHGAGTMGALALVVPVEKVDVIEPLLGMLASADRPMKLFTAVEKANAWIARQTEDQSLVTKSGRRPGRPSKKD